MFRPRITSLRRTEHPRSQGSNIAAGVGWKNWYLVYAGLSAFILIVSVPLVAETKFDRAKASYAGLTGTTAAATTSQTDAIIPKVTQATRPQIDGKRTLKYDLHPAPAKVEWSESWLTLKHMGQMVSLRRFRIHRRGSD